MALAIAGEPSIIIAGAWCRVAGFWRLAVVGCCNTVSRQSAPEKSQNRATEHEPPSCSHFFFSLAKRTSITNLRLADRLVFIFLPRHLLRLFSVCFCHIRATTLTTLWPNYPPRPPPNPEQRCLFLRSRAFSPPLLRGWIGASVQFYDKTSLDSPFQLARHRILFHIFYNLFSPLIFLTQISLFLPLNFVFQIISQFFISHFSPPRTIISSEPGNQATSSFPTSLGSFRSYFEKYNFLFFFSFFINQLSWILSMILAILGISLFIVSLWCFEETRRSLLITRYSETKNVASKFISSRDKCQESLSIRYAFLPKCRTIFIPRSGIVYILYKCRKAIERTNS